MEKDVAQRQRQQASYIINGDPNLKVLKDLSYPLHLQTFIEKNLQSNDEQLGWKPNTAKTYLNSLKLFLKFYRDMHAMGLQQYSELSTLQYSAVVDCINNITKALRKEVVKSKSKARRAADDKKDNLTPDDVKQYMEGNRAKEAQNILLEKHSDPSRTDHTIVRNYLIMMVALANANRTGTITSMTKDDFTAARERVKNGHHIICIDKHKTAGIYGAAELVVNPLLYRQMDIYLSFFRNASDKCQNFFINWGGTAMDRGNVMHVMTTELAALGIQKR